MTFSSKIVDDTQFTTLKQKGWYSATEENRYSDGRAYTEINIHRRMGCCERTLKIGAYSLGALLTCVPWCMTLASGSPCSISCCCKTCCAVEEPSNLMLYFPLSGTDKKVVFLQDAENTRQVVQQDYQNLGFDPTSAESRKTFFLSRSSEKVYSLAHSYVIFQTPFSDSSNVLFAPYDNLDDIRLMPCSHSKTGKPFAIEDLHRVMRVRCKAYTEQHPPMERAANFLPEPTDRTPLIMAEPTQQYLTHQQPPSDMGQGVSSFSMTRAHEEQVGPSAVAAAKVFEDFSNTEI